MKKQVLWSIAIVVGLVVSSSGWIFNTVQNGNDARAAELSELNSSFVQQYGNETTMKQLVLVEKVYAAYWTDKDGIPYVSWNIGGVWAVVYAGQLPEATTP
jgi:hypothetical protein